MSRMTCFNPFRALHDRRFRRKLSGWEFKDFWFLLFFASTECRDPAFIPPHKVADLAMELGMTGKEGRAKFAQRLAKWSAPGIELITLEEGGGIQIDYVLDQDVEESEARAYEPSATGYAPPAGNGHSSAGNGHSPAGNGHSPAGNGSSASGAGNGYSVARRPRKNQSNSADAKSKRYAYWQAKANTTGLIYAYDGITFSPAGHEAPKQEGSENSPENLGPSQSKPPMLTGGLREKEEQNLGLQTSPNSEDSPEVSLARASAVTTVVGGSKDSYTSDYRTPTVARDPNLRQTSEAKTSELPAKTSRSPASGPVRPLPRAVILPQMVPVAREADVKEVMQSTGDDIKWRNQWAALWKHCHRNDLLRCWDEGVAIYAWRLQVSPPSGQGAVRLKAVWLRGTIWDLLAKAGAPYVPASQVSASQEPVDAAEAAEIRRISRETKARWDAEEEQAASVITPLSEIQDDEAITPLGDIMAEMESE